MQNALILLSTLTFVSFIANVCFLVLLLSKIDSINAKQDLSLSLLRFLKKDAEVKDLNFELVEAHLKYVESTLKRLEGENSEDSVKT